MDRSAIYEGVSHPIGLYDARSPDPSGASMRPKTTASLALAGGTAGLLLLFASTRGDEPEHTPENAVTSSRHDAPARPPAAPRRGERGGRASFEELTSSHQPDAIRTALGGVDDWLTETWPEANGAWLGTDCSAPPCLIGVRFEPPEPDLHGAIATSWRDELEARLGWRPWGVLTADDGGGVQYAWMFGMPDELLGGDAIDQRLALVASAGERFDRLMEREGIDPADPASAE